VEVAGVFEWERGVFQIEKTRVYLEWREFYLIVNCRVRFNSSNCTLRQLAAQGLHINTAP
jgi:hypothetical protein